MTVEVPRAAQCALPGTRYVFAAAWHVLSTGRCVSRG